MPKLTDSGSLFQRALLPLIATLQASAVLLCCLPSQAQVFYDHGRQWAHGHKQSGQLVPDDYLVPLGTDGEITRSTPPFGYYATSGGRKLNGGPVQYAQNYYAPQSQVIMRQAVQPNPRYQQRGAGGHSMAWLNGMGGVEDMSDLDLGPLSGVPPVTEQPMYQAEPYDDQVYAAPVRTVRRTSGSSSRPRRIYYRTPAHYTSGPGGTQMINGSGTGYTMTGRGQY